MEQKLQIVENGKYKNVTLHSKPTKGLQGLDDGNFVIVKKTFAEGRGRESEFGKSYSCGAELDGQQVSFWLNETEHNLYKVTGGVGDLVKITMKEEKAVNLKTQKKYIKEVLLFEKVE